MRFHSCPKCNFFLWHNDDILGKARDVIKGLRDNQRELNAENIELLAKVKGLLYELQDAKHTSTRQQEIL